MQYHVHWAVPIVSTIFYGVGQVVIFNTGMYCHELIPTALALHSRRGRRRPHTQDLNALLTSTQVQNYYIDSFEKHAASAIAAGALFRSVVGGIVPLATDVMVGKIGYGWGISVFGFISLALAPAPLVFYYYGEKLRERFRVDL